MRPTMTPLQGPCHRAGSVSKHAFSGPTTDERVAPRPPITGSMAGPITTTMALRFTTSGTCQRTGLETYRHRRVIHQRHLAQEDIYCQYCDYVRTNYAFDLRGTGRSVAEPLGHELEQAWFCCYPTLAAD